MLKENSLTPNLFSELEELALEFQQRAEEVERTDKPPVENLKKLAKIGYYRFVVKASPGERRRSLDLLSSGCGVTSFLSTQHEGVCRRLQDAGHQALEGALAGQTWIGVCFAHLRRDPSPLLALVGRHHVTFTGHGPWFTGHGLMDQVVVGGATPEGEFLMGLTPVDIPEIRVKELPPLSVMNATATVALDFNALVIDQKDIVVRANAEMLQQKDMHSTVFQASRSLGTARAAARFLPSYEREAVLDRLEQHHLKSEKWDSAPTWEGATQLRYEALQFSSQVIRAAFTTVGGKAHLRTHPLQRISREANFYTTTQLTQNLRKKALQELTAQTK